MDKVNVCCKECTVVNGSESTECHSQAKQGGNAHISDKELCYWWKRVTSKLRLECPILNCHEEMPTCCRERHIYRAYRPNPSSVSYCLLSILHPTNETLNFWTHFVPMAFLVVRHILFSQEVLINDIYDQKLLYPFWTYSAGCFILLACSSFAHLFNCISTRIRHVCFCIDYGAISAYSVAGTIAYFYFVSPPLCHGFDADQSSLYVPVATIMAVVSHTACCYTRFPHVRARYLLRTLAYVMPFVILSYPAILRLCDEVERKNWIFRFMPAESHLAFVSAVAAEPLSHPEKSFQTSLGQDPWHCSVNESDDFVAGKASPDQPSVHFCELGDDSFLAYYALHLLFFALAAFFNVSRFPEKLYPGRFDVIGSSHQLFHIAIALGVITQSVVIEEAVRDAAARGLDGLDFHAPVEATAWSTVGLLLLISAVLCAVVAIFDKLLVNRREKRE